jgi:Peptidase family M50
MGIVGPITSAVIGGVCLTLAWALGWTPVETPESPLTVMLVWLGYINITLALFNMIPGFPLDGGRVLRAILWWISGNAYRSTRIAARIGQSVALAFIVFGIISFFAAGAFNGLWMAFVSWFLWEAARASIAQVEVAEGLRDVRVRDIMARGCTTVGGDMSLQTFTEEHLLRTGQRCFIVTANGHITGLITPHEVKEVPRERWPTTTTAPAYAGGRERSAGSSPSSRFQRS